MKRNLLVVVCIACCIRVLEAQVPVFEKKWDHRFGGTEADIVSNFEMTADSGFIVGGTSFSGISGDKTESNYDSTFATSDFWIVKTDESGIMQWDKTFGGNQSEILNEIIITSDGGFLAGGQTFSGISGDKSEPNWDTSFLSNDYWIIKSNQQGIKEWDKRFGGTAYEIFGDVAEDPAGNFIIAGSSFSEISGDKTESSQGGWDYWLVKTDATGNKIWDRRFGGTLDDFAKVVAITSDGNYIVGGYSISNSGGDKSQDSQGLTDYWIVKVDASGNKVFDKTFGGDDTDWLFAITATSDGGFILGGQSYSGVTGDKSEPNHDPTSSSSDRWIVKTDSVGIKQWDRAIGGTETEDVSLIVQTTDGGYMVSGESYSDNTGNKTENNLGPEQTWVVKTDQNGIVLWDKTIFSYGHDEEGLVIPYGEDCFVAMNFTVSDTGGYKSENSWGYGDLWMIKMCESDPLSIHEPNFISAVWNVSPNPFTNEIIIENLSQNTIRKIMLFDNGGRLLKQIDVLNQQAGQMRIEIPGLAPGFYVCRIIGLEQVQNIPLIKQ